MANLPPSENHNPAHSASDQEEQSPYQPPYDYVFPTKEPEFAQKPQYQFNQAMQGQPSLEPAVAETLGANTDLNLRDLPRSLFITTKMIIAHPFEFFRNLYQNDYNGPGLIYLVICTIIGSLLSILSTFILNFNLGEASVYFYISFATLIISLMGAILILILTGGLIWMIAKIFNGKGSFPNTMKGLSYVNGVLALITWIPNVGQIFIIYAFFLQMIMVSRTHKIGLGRSFLILVVPFIIIYLIIRRSFKFY